MPMRWLGAHLPLAAAAATLALLLQGFPGTLAAVVRPTSASPRRSGGGNNLALDATKQLGRKSATKVYREETFEVNVTKGVVYGQGLVCSEEYTNCSKKDLLLDVYDPVAESGTAPRPVRVLVHGGTEVDGGRDTDVNMMGAADYFSRRGFVVFVVDYRLEGEHGLYPCPEEGCRCDVEEGNKHWYRKQCYVYPPVRDYKAAIRFIRAHSQQFNIDDRLIVAGGGSSGATNVLLAALGDEDVYKSEFDTLQDPTLSSTNLKESSSIRMAVLMWPFAQAVTNAIKAFGRDHFPFRSNTTLDTDLLPAVLHFHGALDTFADYDMAQELAEELQGRGMQYEFFGLQECSHQAWCGSPFQDDRNCDSYISNASVVVEECVCKLACPMQDIYSFSAIVKQLSLELL